MHAEHELLQRTYVNRETMYGDDVSDILRENFFVSEDGLCVGHGRASPGDYQLRRCHKKPA